MKVSEIVMRVVLFLIGIASLAHGSWKFPDIKTYLQGASVVLCFMYAFGLIFLALAPKRKEGS